MYIHFFRLTMFLNLLLKNYIRASYKAKSWHVSFVTIALLNVQYRQDFSSRRWKSQARRRCKPRNDKSLRRADNSIFANWRHKEVQLPTEESIILRPSPVPSPGWNSSGNARGSNKPLLRVDVHRGKNCHNLPRNFRTSQTFSLVPPHQKLKTSVTGMLLRSRFSNQQNFIPPSSRITCGCEKRFCKKCHLQSTNPLASVLRHILIISHWI